MDPSQIASRLSAAKVERERKGESKTIDVKLLVFVDFLTNTWSLGQWQRPQGGQGC